MPFITLPLLSFITNHRNGSKWVFIAIYYLGQLVDADGCAWGHARASTQIEGYGASRESDFKASHATVLLMPIQSFLRKMMESHWRLLTLLHLWGHIPCVLLSSCAFLVREDWPRDHARQSRCSRLLPTRGSPIHLFKYNCSNCFIHASCVHVLLASMVYKPKIVIPVQYIHSHNFPSSP